MKEKFTEKLLFAKKYGVLAKCLSLGRSLAVGVLLCSWMSAAGEVTLERCLERARENYPVIKRYALLESTERLELSDIDKGWLPKITLYAQGSAQNVVPELPEALTGMLQQMGKEVRGLGKLQYKVGVELNQNIWDGGASKNQRELARQKTRVGEAALDVEMYEIRSRVESYYFGVLLTEARIEQTETALRVFDANVRRLRSMLASGAAMQSDVDLVEAEMLAVKQQLAQTKHVETSLRKALSLFTGEDLSSEQLAVSVAEIPSEAKCERPELRLFEAQMALNARQRSMAEVAQKPKIGFFAQGYYGYPGIDYFKAMMKREPSLNLLAGVRLSWNIDSYYTKENTRRKLDLADKEIDAYRETFLFNNKIQSSVEQEEIEGIKALMQDDTKIVELRRNVRRASESQLRNGIIDATALVSRINEETQAELSATYHKLQYIQAIYNLKRILNQ